MAVARVLAHAHIADDVHLGRVLADDAARLLHHAVLVPRARADFVLFCGDAEQQDVVHAAVEQFLDLGHEHVERHLEHARHAGNLVAPARARLDEQRVDEVFCRELGLADHLAGELAVAHAARAVLGELSVFH